MAIKERISVIGLGYIGLPTAAILAKAGFHVHGVDVRADAIALINNGQIHINEDGLGELVEATVRNGRLRASSEPVPADVHIVAVPTPINQNKQPDLSYVESAVRTISSVLKAGDLVIVESTSPPRTCLDVVAPLIEKLTGLDHMFDYDLAYCPERVIPGNILNEIVNNDRIVGGTTSRATERTVALYSSFVRGQLLRTDATTAEMCKLMENTYRDVNIALANELSEIAVDLGVDVYEAIDLANHHPRVNIHRPGIGVGGHCIPVDPWFLLNGDVQTNQLIYRARVINDKQPNVAASSITDALLKYPNQPVTFLGLTYKPDTDDFRESPALRVAESVSAMVTDREIYVSDPYLIDVPHELADLNVRLLHMELLSRQTGLLVELVPHSAFRTLTYHPDALYLRHRNNWVAQDPAEVRPAIK